VAGYTSLMSTPALHLGFLAPAPLFCGPFGSYFSALQSDLVVTLD
jgi:hypothetical protein